MKNGYWLLMIIAALMLPGCSRQAGEADEFADRDMEFPQIVITSESQLDDEVAFQAERGETEDQAEPLPPEGAERNKKIQACLKNANLYYGNIDGKIGPLTRKAIVEFQNMKGLEADGKVGPATWSQLRKYLKQ